MTAKPTARNVALGLIGAALVAAAAALGTDEDLRKEVLASAKALGDEIAGKG